MHVAFDLEIAKEIPEGQTDWRELRPLRVSCAATLTHDRELKLWHGGLGTARYAPCMTPANVGGLIAYLKGLRSQGYDIVTWNGLGFDFDILAEESFFESSKQECQELALGHIDIAFQMLCEKGFMCGLDAAATGMGVSAKMHEVGGAKAPTMWASEKSDQELVLQYVAQDVKSTIEVYEAMLKFKAFRWLTKAGRLSTYYPQFKDGRLLTVSEALELPEPDTSWLSNPWPRSKFTGWTRKENNEQKAD